MQTQVTDPQPSARAAAKARDTATPLEAGTAWSFETLAQRTSAELEVVFATAQPFALNSLRGDPRGRALATPGFDRGVFGALLRRIHASALTPWEGKSFGVAPDGSSGVGTNRVRLPMRRALLAFRTYETASVVDGKPCVAIDYDVPDNPSFVRATYDELRLLDDGLYLGRGMRKRPGRAPRLLIWFALDANRPDPRVAWAGY